MNMSISIIEWSFLGLNHIYPLVLFIKSRNFVYLHYNVPIWFWVGYIVVAGDELAENRVSKKKLRRHPVFSTLLNTFKIDY